MLDDDGAPYHDPKLLDMWGDALAGLPDEPAFLLEYLRADGSLNGALAEQLALSLTRGDLVLSRAKRRGPSPQVQDERKQRRFEIGAYIYVRVANSPRASQARIIGDAAEKVFSLKVDYCESCFKEFRREFRNLNFENGMDVLRHHGRAWRQWCKENGLCWSTGEPLSGENAGE